MLSSTGDCDVTIMTACPEIATDTEISQNNTNLAKKRNLCYLVVFSLLLLW